VTIADTYPPPDWLDPDAAICWTELEPELRGVRRVLTSGDLNQFAAYCGEVATFRQASRDLAAHPGWSLKRKSQLLGFRRHAAVEMRKWAAEFGLTPSARVRTTGAPAAKPRDALTRFIKRSS
jgi:P27 family predicted phage terminase small subunit